MLFTGKSALEHLKENGTSEGFEKEILPWQERQALVELDLFDETSKRFPEEI